MNWLKIGVVVLWMAVGMFVAAACCPPDVAGSIDLKPATYGVVLPPPDVSWTDPTVTLGEDSFVAEYTSAEGNRYRVEYDLGTRWFEESIW